MGYLFFLLSILYSFIFYVFYSFSNKKDIFWNDLNIYQDVLVLSLKDNIIFSNENTIVLQTIFWSLIYEIIIFIFISIILFFYFWSFSLSEEDDKKIEQNNQKNILKNIFNKDNLIKLFKYFSYYIWFILAYISLYLISYSLEIHYSYFIFFLNILIFLFYFLSQQSSLSREFLKINSIIFSLFYLINYFYIIITNNNFFYLIDFINWFLILLIFPLFFYYDRFLVNKNNLDNSLLIHFSVYIFWFTLFYLYFYIFKENLLFWFSFICSIFWVIWFEFLPKIKILKKDELILKYIWIIFTYFSIFFWIIYQINHFSIIIYIILLTQIIYNLFIHKKYNNYISFFLSVLIFTYLTFYSLYEFSLINYETIYYLIFCLVLSFWMIFSLYFYKKLHLIDNYIVIFFSLIINLLWIITFFIFNNFEILYIWILLLIESIYFFLSYFKLNPNKK